MHIPSQYIFHRFLVMFFILVKESQYFFKISFVFSLQYIRYACDNIIVLKNITEVNQLFLIFCVSICDDMCVFL